MSKLFEDRRVLFGLIVIAVFSASYWAISPRLLAQRIERELKSELHHWNCVTCELGSRTDRIKLCTLRNEFIDAVHFESAEELPKGVALANMGAAFNLTTPSESLRSVDVTPDYMVVWKAEPGITRGFVCWYSADARIYELLCTEWQQETSSEPFP